MRSIPKAPSWLAVFVFGVLWNAVVERSLCAVLLVCYIFAVCSAGVWLIDRAVRT